VSKNIKKKEIS